MLAGLRFRRGDARVLRNHVEELKRHGIDRSHISLFENAALAAENGEPLQVQAQTIDEVQSIASAFTFYGLRRPVIDDLSGQAVE